MAASARLIRAFHLVAVIWLQAIFTCPAAADAYSQYRSPAGETAFAMEYPKWESRKSGNPLNAVSVVRPDRGCYFDLEVADGPLDRYQQVVQKYVRDQGVTILSADPLSYDFQTGNGKYSFRSHTRGMNCGRKSYLATISCLRENFDQAAMAAAFESMGCATQAAAVAKPKSAAKPLVGVVVSHAGEFNARSMQDAFRIAREGGAQVTRTFIMWSDIESRKGQRSWQGTDYMMQLVRDQGLRLAVAFNTIHTAIRGPLPGDIRFKQWNDAELVDRFSDFVLAFLERYGDVVGYVEIGNEVNAYFMRHPDEVQQYREFFTAVHARIKQRFPAVRVGIVYTFHEMQAHNDFSIYEQLRAGDFDGFTLYIYNEGFRFDRPPREIFDALQQIARITGARPFAVDEVGWSAAPSLGGSEAAQRSAVAATFDFLDHAPDRLLFLAWFNLHDGRRQDCDQIARTFVKSGDAMSRDTPAMRIFSDFLCNLGLRTNDGKTRSAWDEWVRRARALGSR